MSNVALRIEHLAKQYVIGTAKHEYGTLRDALTEAVCGLSRVVSGKRERRRSSSIWALRDVSFEVRHGEAVGIIGRNGAGKSTLLKILSRITAPSGGRAEVYGRIGSLLEVGTGFHPELTGRDNVYLNGAILGMRRSEIHAKFDAIVDFSGVEQFLDTPVKRYSSGMYTRLAFAVAAHLDPDILIVDEVLAVGDAVFQKKCLGKLGEMAQTGRTVLFVSHNMGLMQTLCRRGIVFQDGEVVCDDTSDRAAAMYLNGLETAAAQSLAERTDRQGAGAVRLDRIEITSGNGNAGSLVAGGPARFRFIANGSFQQQSWFGLTIFDHMGAPVTHLSSRHRSPDDCDDGGEREFICEIDELPLVPGRYRIAAVLFADGELQDHLAAAAYFNVEHGAIRGRPVADQGGNYGRVVLPHRWILPFPINR
jgi:lipopolysaccharide transport system ATP-binding protein